MWVSVFIYLKGGEYMTVGDIITRTTNFKGYKYWYGGKGELATIELAKRLKAENPSVWSDNYYSKAIKDCNGTNRVADCSCLVCKAYDISNIGSYQIADKYQHWNAEPKTGMILWRKGHVGIYDNGIVHQMKGIDYDYYDEPYNATSWSKILYDTNVNYNVAVDETKCGWHSDENGWWYRYKDGTGPDTYYHDTCKIIGGHAYLFNSGGYITDLTGNKHPNTEQRGWIDE